MPYLHWNPALTAAPDARDALASIIEIASVELPFAAQVARLAMAARTREELVRYLSSLYRIGLEHGHWSLPDLVDGLLRWIEQVDDPAALQLPWEQVA